MVSPVIAVRGGRRYARIGLQFDGSGTLSDANADGTVDITGAADSYRCAYLAAGYMF